MMQDALPTAGSSQQGLEAPCMMSGTATHIPSLNEMLIRLHDGDDPAEPHELGPRLLASQLWAHTSMDCCLAGMEALSLSQRVLIGYISLLEM